MEPDREQSYRRRIATLEAQLGQALQRLAELEAENARLKKNSSNSSKPPSSDIVKPPGPPTPKGGGKIGGQPGHVRHEREDFPPEQVDQFQSYHLKRCPGCGGKVHRTKEIAQVLQQLELVEQWCQRI